MFLKTPRRASSVVEHFGLSKTTCYRTLQILEDEGVLEVHWVQDKKFYSAKLEEFLNELKNQQ